MNKATLGQIVKENLFFKFDHFVVLPNVGKCKIVAIHGKDLSTAEFYQANLGSIRVSLMPLSGANQIKLMLPEDTEFELVEAK